MTLAGTEDIQAYDSDTETVLSETKEIRDVRDEYGEIAGEFTIYGKRWVVLAVFSFCLAVNSGCWVTYAQITYETSLYYDVDTKWIDVLSLLFMIWFLPINFPACIVLEKHGLRVGTLIASGCTALGAGLRVIGTSHSSFAAVIVGQSLTAIGQPFLLNALPKVSSVWFPESERALATILGSASQLLGSALGFTIPPAFVESIGSSDSSATASEADGVFTTNCFFAGMAAASFLLALFVVDKSPPTPPSLSAESVITDHQSMVTKLRTTLSNVPFLFLCVAVGITLGIFNTLATILNQVVTPYGYSNTESGLFGASSIVMGLIGSGVTGVIVDRTHRYKSVLVAWMTAGTGAMFVFYISLAGGRTALLMVCCGVVGFFVLPVIALAMELGAELTFPLDESLSAGLILSSGQIFGIGSILGFQTLIDADEYKLSAFLLAIAMLAATCTASLVGGLKAPVYKRRVYELGNDPETRSEHSSVTDKLI